MLFILKSLIELENIKRNMNINKSNAEEQNILNPYFSICTIA